MSAKILPIKIYPDKILRQKAAKINRLDKKIQRLILDMGKTMLAKEGAGLAAPQVGESIRLIVVNTKNGVLAMINPKITRRSWSKEPGEEGCLSLPDIIGQVKRSKKIKVIYYNEDNKQIKLSAAGLFARVIQHEVDHLNGVLFIDYLKKKGLPAKFREQTLR
ncbi:peptide deformylase [Candidatus Falkowbacteria bacterium CG10_big_fil_rev_8_21_14_0_10_43_11]|uniref:Peptide deformylase n=1 Tax=Candidatus Falkowbacteria bacterium CG10_big_fil_rev_8_21_14_0_10_43_11 TaxID=1974568 RepID=A0A2M6WMV6_9BACT|nr:MAG: peptide deformylase [Candidatus Falkowbacteria bacterium CG10_big_fil_rev_8_21_14_0_10_43_11]